MSTMKLTTPGNIHAVKGPWHGTVYGLSSNRIHERAHTCRTPRAAYEEAVVQDIAARAPLWMLVIEDNPGEVGLIRAALTASGVPYRLDVVATGRDALAFLAPLAADPTRPCPDLILLDLLLPQVPGRDVLQYIKTLQQCAQSLIVVFTGLEAPAERTAALQLGADAYLVKPGTLDAYLALGDRLLRLWERHRTARGDISPCAEGAGCG
jgi:CheY-like chemotaxis protein